MLNKIEFDLVIFSWENDSFHLKNFQGWIFNLYENELVYNFHLGEIYYIHIIDKNGKIFEVIPIKLDNLGDYVQIEDCFYKLKIECIKFFDTFNDKFIRLYINRNNVESLNIVSILNELINARYEAKKLLFNLKIDDFRIIR
jgi:hypothetical protein